MQQEKLKKIKTYSTHDSRVVPDHSTRWAQPCLTAEFGWDPVYPRWYDRMMFCGPILCLHGFQKAIAKRIGKTIRVGL